MYNATVDDLARIVNDLSQISSKYTAGSQELDHQRSSLDATASQLIYGGSIPWTGLASEAFQGAWGERRSRMQQASQLLSQAASYLTQFTQTIDENLPTIRRDQQIEQGLIGHILPSGVLSVLDGESQAQNTILTALSALNAQLEELEYEVRNCPEEEQVDSYPYNNNINKSDSSGEGGKTPEERIGDAVNDPAVAHNLIDLAKKNGANLEDVAMLLDLGIKPDIIEQLINNKANLRDIATNAQILLDGGINPDLVNGWLKNGRTDLNNAVRAMNQGVDLNALGTGDKVQGEFDYPHERVQASEFVAKEGGTFIGVANNVEGIDGYYIPEGTTELIPVSLKNYSDSSGFRGLIGKININARHIQIAGYSNVILDVNYPQMTSANMLDFIEHGPIKNMPSEGSFQSLLFKCSDGTVIVDSSGARIVR